MLSDCNWVNQAQLKQPCMVFMLLLVLLFPIAYNCDMDHEVSKIEQLAPFLVFTGIAGDENACMHSYSLAVSSLSWMIQGLHERILMP